jgi:hypothetical protein
MRFGGLHNALVAVHGQIGAIGVVDTSIKKVLHARLMRDGVNIGDGELKAHHFARRARVRVGHQLIPRAEPDPVEIPAPFHGHSIHFCHGHAIGYQRRSRIHGLAIHIQIGPAGAAAIRKAVGEPCIVGPANLSRAIRPAS